MYEFVLNMYLLGRITKEKVHSFIGRYITEDEYEEIIRQKE